MIIAKWNEPCIPEVMPRLLRLPGEDRWVNLVDWMFVSKTGYECFVPRGFVCDLDSVPRIPFVYAKFKGRCVAAPLAHDLEYSHLGRLARRQADDLMLEIGLWEKTDPKYIEPMHRGVIVFGHKHFRKNAAEFLYV